MGSHLSSYMGSAVSSTASHAISSCTDGCPFGEQRVPDAARVGSSPTVPAAEVESAWQRGCAEADAEENAENCEAGRGGRSEPGSVGGEASAKVPHPMRRKQWLGSL